MLAYYGLQHEALEVMGPWKWSPPEAQDHSYSISVQVEYPTNYGPVMRICFNYYFTKMLLWQIPKSANEKRLINKGPWRLLGVNLKGISGGKQA